ncbi:MAG: hypothetical protein ACR2PR_06325 [Pseudohongiellaceae bacterium]
MKILFISILMVVFAGSAHAFGNNQGQQQGQGQGQAQGQIQGQGQGQAQGQIGINKSTNNNNSSAKSGSYSSSKAGAAAGAKSNVNIENTEVHPDDITVRQLGNVYLNPSNNTSRCIKAWGIATGNKDIQGVLGVPTRDRECDLNVAAEQAFKQGNMLLGWQFKCNMKSVNRLFKTTYTTENGQVNSVSRHKTAQDRHARCMSAVKRTLQ